MLKKICYGPAIALLLSVATTAKADSGFYISGSAGTAFHQASSTQQITTIPGFTIPGNSLPGIGMPGFVGPPTIVVPPISIPPTTLDVQRKYHFSPGVTLNAAVGYKFDLSEWGAIRAEAELGYMSYDLDRIVLSGTTNRIDIVNSGATALRLSGTINIFYDLPTSGPLVPFIGVGLGGQHGEDSSGRAVGIYPSGTTAPVRILGGSGQSGIWLAEAGFSIALTDAVSLVPAYRYEQTFEGTQPAHIAKLGLRYSF